MVGVRSLLPVIDLDSVMKVDSVRLIEKSVGSESEHFIFELECPHGGRLSNFSHRWDQITNDPLIKQIVQGYVLELEETPQGKHLPTQSFPPGPSRQAIEKEIRGLLENRAIKVATADNAYFFPICFWFPRKQATCGLLSIFRTSTSLSFTDILKWKVPK